MHLGDGQRDSRVGDRLSMEVNRSMTRGPGRAAGVHICCTRVVCMTLTMTRPRARDARGRSVGSGRGSRASRVGTPMAEPGARVPRGRRVWTDRKLCWFIMSCTAHRPDDARPLHPRPVQLTSMVKYRNFRKISFSTPRAREGRCTHDTACVGCNSARPIG